MSKSLSILPILALLAGALFATGCGGSGSTISKAEFIEQGDAICKATDVSQPAEFRAFEQKHAKSLTRLHGEGAEEKLITAVGLPSITKEAEELEALGIPKGDEKELEALFTGIEEAVKRVEKVPESIEASSGEPDPFNEVNKLAREYGFKACDEVI
jgi:hypothetical protein